MSTKKVAWLSGTHSENIGGTISGLENPTCSDLLHFQIQPWRTRVLTMFLGDLQDFWAHILNYLIRCEQPRVTSNLP